MIRSSFFKATAAFAVVLLLLSFPLHAYYKKLVSAEQIRLQEQLDLLGSDLTSKISQKLVILESLSAFIQAHDGRSLKTDHFINFARQMYHEESGVRALQFFPAKGPVAVYPFSRNKQVIGRTLDDLIRDERVNVRKDLQTTITSKEIVISTPYELRQGGLGVVARLAVFQEDELLGVAVIVLDVPPLLESINMGSFASILNVAIYDQNDNFFWGNKSPIENYKLVANVPFASAHWTLVGDQLTGLGTTVTREIISFSITAVAFSFLFSIFIYISTGQKLRLESAVEERTRSLKRSEDKYINLIESLPISVFTKDRDFRYSSINSGGASELKAKSEKIIGKTDEAFYSKDIAEVHKNNESKVFTEKVQTEYEIQLIEDDGEQWRHNFRIPLLDDAGKVSSILGISWNISDQKLKELKLKQTETEHNALIDTSSDGFWLVDTKGNLLDVNAAYIQRSGYSRDELTSMHISQLEAEESFQDTRNHIQKLMTNGNELFETAHITKNGEVWPVEVSASFLPGAFPKFFAFLRDIGDRKKYEAELIDANIKVSEAVHGGQIGLWFWNLETDEVEFSPEWKAQIGYENDEINASFEEWSNRVHPDDLTRSLKALDEIQANPEKKYRSEYRLRHKNGSWRWIVSTGSVVFDEKGKATKIVGAHIDVTDRRQQEEQMREQKALLEEAHILSGLGYWRWNIETGEVDWTDEIYKIFQLNRETFKPDIESILVLSPWAEYENRGKELIEAAKNNKQDGSYEQRFLKPDGSTGFYTSTYRGKYDDNGQLIEIRGTVLDITERKIAENQLRDSEKRASRQRQALVELTLNVDLASETTEQAIKKLVTVLAKTLDVARAGVWLLENNQKTLKNLVLYEAEEERYSSGLSIETSDIAGYFDAIIRDNRVFVSDTQHDNRTKGLLDDYLNPLGITSLLDAGVFVDGELRGVVCVEHTGPQRTWLNDEEAFVSNLGALIAQWFISEKNLRTSKALATSENRFKTMFEKAPLGVALIDSRTGDFCEVNSCYADILGLTIQDVQSIDWMTVTHPDDIQADHDNMDMMNSGEVAGFSMEKRYIKPDGSLVWVNLTVSKITVDNERPMHLAMVEDITSRKHDETELQELSIHLENRVKQRTEELELANKELDSFAYAVSHDLRAPLRALSGFSNALIEDYGDVLEGDASIYLDQIKIASSNMSDLIDGLLTLSRSTRGDMRKDKVDLSALFNSRFRELQDEQPERNISMLIPDSLAVLGDKRMLQVVVNNLLDNAWKYTSKVDAPTIEIYSEKEDQFDRICIKDNGAGFDMEYAERLFKPFQRLHRQDEFPGIGIGLATVQRIVHRHGGDISATSKPEEGALICFTLDSKSEGVHL